jgi:carboxyl-terminal processing protease
MRSNRARLLFVVGSIAALLSLRAVTTAAGPGRDSATRSLSIFSDIFSLTRSNYVESTDAKTLLEGAYDGMSDALDPFSYYVPASERAAFRAQQSSGAINPGIVIARRGGFPYVVAPVAGSPAEKAGVKPGDLIDTVDGKPVRNASLWKVKAALEGPENTKVELLVFRGGDEKRVTLKVPRTRFESPALSSRIEGDVFIVKIPAFRKDTAGALKQALVEAKAKSPKSLIIDVRGAIGGDVADAVPCAALFTGPGVIARPVSRKLVLQPLEAGEKAEKAWSGKTVVLIDDATGGAAEVFAAAIHDRASAVTVGETTVGMAIVQRQVPTEAGGTLSMTVARYVSPSGTVLAGKGMSPDDRVIVFPDRTGASTPANPSQDPILERGLEVARGAVPGRRAA